MVKYLAPEMEVVSVETTDVILVSIPQLPDDERE
jgi:hypothetical protein